MSTPTAIPSALQERIANATSICELFQTTAAERPDEVALRTVGGGVELTWADYASRVKSIAAGLSKLGVRRGDAVAIMMTNRPEFNLVDMAAVHLGATPFSVYNTLPADEISYLFTNAGAKVAICEAAFAPRIKDARDSGTAIETIVCLDEGIEGTVTLADVESAPAEDFDFDASWRAVGPDDVLTLIYTSGTTGPPKGVELTHGNMLAQLRGTTEMLPTTPGGRTLSFLPSAHIADRWASHYSAVAMGTQITSVADPTQLLQGLVECRPTFWGAVPRIWEKFKAALDAGIAAETDPQRKAGIEKALDVGLQVSRLKLAGEPVPDELAAAYAQLDEMVLSKFREKLGLDQAEVIVVGAAPSPRELLEFFMAIGLPLLELWGMSEISCCGTINPPGGIRVGTVGQPIPGVEVKLAEDGELLIKGGTIMRGYRGEPEKTAETIDPDGWLHTGDVAEIDDDGYVKIVDRKKELIINAAGKNMSPSNIEGHLKSSHALIGQAICVGDMRPYNVALLVLDPDAVAQFARQNGLEGDDATPAAVAKRDDVKAAIAAAVEEANGHLARVEQIKRFAILEDEWMPGGEELTPTMKLKRKPIHAKYEAEIEALYAQA